MTILPAGAGQTRAIIKMIETALSDLPPIGRSRVLTAAGIVLGLNTKPRRQRKPRPAVPGGLLTAAQAAARLGCSIKTLKGHVATNGLKYVIVGHGKKRPRMMFAPSDLDVFIEAQTQQKDSPCPSSAPRARVTGTSISGTKVIAFTHQPRPQSGVKPKK
jgi:Helix-turn-helix domain